MDRGSKQLTTAMTQSVELLTCTSNLNTELIWNKHLLTVVRFGVINHNLSTPDDSCGSFRSHTCVHSNVRALLLLMQWQSLAQSRADPELPPAPPPSTNFSDMIRNLPRWQLSLLAHLEPVQTADRSQQLLESGKKLQLHLISDGGVKANQGSFAWELAVGRNILWK
jgi:hypothetical protein